MSSPKAAPRKASRAVSAAPRKAAAGAGAGAQDVAARASQLAAEIEGNLARGDLIAAEALQALMAALCKTYAAHIEAGHDFMPLKSRVSANSTDIMTTASGLLKSQSLAVFELGMWQSWTGR